MRPEAYERVKQAFAEAIRLTSSERMDYVQSNFGDDPEVLREVQSLLKHYSDATKNWHADQTQNSAPAVSDSIPPTIEIASAKSSVRIPTASTWKSSLKSVGPIGLLPLGGLGVCILLIVVVLYVHSSLHRIVEERRTTDVQSVLRFVEQSIDTWAQRERAEVERLLASSEFRQIAIDLDAANLEGSDIPVAERLALKAKVDEELHPYLGNNGSYAVWTRNLEKRYDTRPERSGDVSELSSFGIEVMNRVLDGETVILFPGERPALSSDTDQVSYTPFVRVVSPVYGLDQEILAIILLRSPRVAQEFAGSLSSLTVGKTGEAFVFDRSGLVLTRSRFQSRLAELGLVGSSSGNSDAPLFYLRVPNADLRSDQVDSSRRSNWPLSTLVEEATVSPQGVNLDGYLSYMGYSVHGSWLHLPQYDVNVAYEISSEEANRAYSLLKLESTFIVVLTVACLAGIVASMMSVHRLRRRIATLRVVGSYTLLDKIGEGGMGQVFLARHTLLKRPTAVKLLKPEVRNHRTIELFEREVQIASQLQHPNTIQIFDYGETDNGQWYYAMEFVDGVNLASLSAEPDALTVDRLITILAQVAAAVGEAHQNGVIHRDIKPQNIMVSDRAGVSDFVKVLDFGLATVLGPQGGTGDIKIAGTIRYMAPECFLTPQEIGPASDVYSMGAMLYELLGETQLVPLPIRETGSVTAWAERLENLALALPEQASAPTWNRLRVLSLVSMAVNPQARPGDANEFLRQLESIRARAVD